MNNPHRAEDTENAQNDAGQAADQRAAFAETAKRVGEQLTALREGRNLSLEDISARLKVSPAKLKALEAGTWDSLPEMPFIQGVVRGYARMLEADPVPLIEALRPFGRRAPIDIPPPSNATGIPRSPVHFRSPARNGAAVSRWIWVAGVVIAVGLAGWWYGSHRAASPAVAPFGPTGASSVPAGADPASASGAEAPVVEAPAVAVAQPPASQAVAAVSASEAAAPAAVAAAVPAAASAPTSVQVSAAAAAASGDAVGNGEAKLHLRLSGDSWVEVRAGNGKVLLSQLLKGGASQDVTGPAPFKVVIGNVAGVGALQFNGQPVELKSRGAGNVARLTLQ